jgi:hypothetical protein
MRTLFLVVLVASVTALPATKKAQQPKPPAIAVLETAAHRDQDRLNIDARIKNTGERQATDIVIIVDVLDSDKNPLTTQKGSSDPESLDPGQEGEFHAQLPLPPRAVFIRLSFEDGGARDIKATNTGPFAID